MLGCFGVAQDIVQESYGSIEHEVNPWLFESHSVFEKGLLCPMELVTNYSIRYVLNNSCFP
jgi:hypothetical protein